MFELLVPAEKAQLDHVKGDKKAYDLELRPRLMVQTIMELQDAQVEPDVWKIEGLDRRKTAKRLWLRHAAADATMSAASSWAGRERPEGTRVVDYGSSGAGFHWLRRRPNQFLESPD